jgi:NADH:quinone reductase (non-electrogenic)
MKTTRPRVVIVGAGFGGLTAARTLAGSPVDVLLLDRNNYHLFQPLLYQVAVAALPPAEIAAPVRSILRRQRNLEFRIAEIVRIDPVRRVVVTPAEEIPYDTLILASGAATNFFGLDGVRRHGFDLKDLPGALRLRNHLIRCFEAAIAAHDPGDRRALLTIAVAGGGPTGVEVAGAVSELLRRVLRRDYPAIPAGDVRVVLLEGGPRILSTMPEELSAAAAASLRRLDVEVRLGARVVDFDGRVARLAGGETLSARTLVWAAGVAAAPLGGTLGVEVDAAGRIPVTPTLELRDHPEVFVVGDAALVRTADGTVPALCPPAIQMGAAAARNVLHRLAGRPLEPFRYKDPGTMATIGRSAAVVALGRLRLTGFPAWVVWLFVHLMQLVGFRNKLVVFVDWAWQYLFYTPASPLILEGDALHDKELDSAPPAR